MKSINYPRIFNTNKQKVNIVSDYYATLQNLKLLLYSDKGELFGDPYYGCNLKKFLYDQNDTVLKDIVIDDIYTAISIFMPQIRVERRDIILEADNVTVKVTIKALNRVNFQTNLYNLVLLRVVV